jgi:apolipoprotein N-acyltransferase
LNDPGVKVTDVLARPDSPRSSPRWRRRALAALSGMVATAALPPLDAVPLLCLAFPGLLLLLAATPGWRAAFAVGWWFGFGHFTAGLYWLAWPLTLELARFGWMIPFAVFGVSAVLALAPAAAAATIRATGTAGTTRVLLFAAAWAVGEWLRGDVVTGFPWALIATAWDATVPMMQSVSVVGVYGLGLVTVVIAAAPVLLVERGLSRMHRVIGCGGAVVLLAVLWSWGAGRAAAGDARPVDGVRVRLVQANVPQTLKWAERRREQNFADYLALTTSAGFANVTHVVWPESAIDYRLATDHPALGVDADRRERLAAAVPRGGALILGAVRDRRRRRYNSVHVVAPDGTVIATYDKHRLVPFGEYVPLRWLLRRLGIEQIAHGVGDTDAGAGPATVAVPNAPATTPLVCYEAIFAVRAAGRGRPGWLVNVTNDAWFGRTSGPYQHFAAARLRAVEAGLPLVRAANTGITAVVDAYGRVTARLPLMTTGVLDADLPRPIAAGTVYGHLGEWTWTVLVLLDLLVALVVGVIPPAGPSRAGVLAELR